LSLPPTLVAEEKEALQKQTREYLTRQGVSAQHLEKEKDRLEKEISEEAGRRVGLYYCLSAIARQENIKVSDDDLEAEKKKMLAPGPDKKEVAERYFNEHKDEIAGRLLEDKVIKFLEDQAIIS
jgi:FKBP-type peptidyl-prolyl cis-trans isomerase (trigger factor)